MKTTRLFAAALLLGCCLLCGLSSCRTSRPHPDERVNAPILAPAVALDTAHFSVNDTVNVSVNNDKDASPRSPKIGVIARLFGHKTALIGQKRPFLDASTRKCKNCQITYVVGNDNKVSQVTAGKKAGPVTLADSGATVQVATNATAIRGNGNSTTQTAAPPAPKPGFFAGIKTFFTGLAHWLLWLLLLLLILAVLFRRRLPFLGPFFS